MTHPTIAQHPMRLDQDELERWKEKLMGKTIVDGPVAAAEAATSFSRASLPEKTRVITPGMPVTRDYRIERMNVGLDDSGKVCQVYRG
ncbi:hypothetical protein BC828DRAFT_378818 [Blastocladiella britannica]|nr:hypothetical protein BC828DRAFT_378818 [Blastocladiella britannica]